MEYKKVLIDDVIPYSRNPRKNDGEALNQVKESIRQCGYIAPVIVDEEMVILAGHTRHKALKELGYKEIDIVIRAGMTEDQKKKYRILDNRINELSYWDFEKLLEEVEAIEFDGHTFDLERLMERAESKVESGFEFNLEDFDDEKFKHECPECGFRFN